MIKHEMVFDLSFGMSVATKRLGYKLVSEASSWVGLKVDLGNGIML